METASTLILSLVLFQPVHAAPDPCRALVPPAVAAAVAAALPGYRLPLATDSDPEALALNKANGGTGCNALASADFNADGRLDFALLLTHEERGPARSRLFVDPLVAGRYRRTASAESQRLGKAELPSINSSRPGVVVGVVESWEFAYFLTAQGWRHVQMAN